MIFIAGVCTNEYILEDLEKLKLSNIYNFFNDYDYDGNVIANIESPSLNKMLLINKKSFIYQ